jgi:hypothetical protein
MKNKGGTMILNKVFSIGCLLTIGALFNIPADGIYVLSEFRQEFALSIGAVTIIFGLISYGVECKQRKSMPEFYGFIFVIVLAFVLICTLIIIADQGLRQYTRPAAFALIMTSCLGIVLSKKRVLDFQQQTQ